jgi:hypothetical protein
METSVLARNAWTTLAVCLPLSAALACGPSRNREVTTIIIEAPADRVWAVVGNYGDLSWTGRISTTEATGGSVPEVARRRFTFASGAVFTDTLTAYDPAGRTLSFRTDDEDWRELPVEGYVSKLTVREENGKSIVEWRGAFSRGYLKNDPPPELSDDAAIAAVSAFQKASLFSLKQKMESGS